MAGTAPAAPSCASAKGLPMQVPTLMPRRLTCSAMALSWRAWPAAASAGMPAPPSLQLLTMLSSAGLPRTACTNICLAHHAKSDFVGRVLRPAGFAGLPAHPHSCCCCRLRCILQIHFAQACDSASQQLCICLHTVARDSPGGACAFMGLIHGHGHNGSGRSSASDCCEEFVTVPNLAALSVPISCHRAIPTSPAAMKDPSQ